MLCYDNWSESDRKRVSMKLLALTLALLSIESYAGVTTCHYKNGETYSRNTGLRVARTMNPRVLSGANLVDLVQSQNYLQVRSTLNNFYQINNLLPCRNSDMDSDHFCFEGYETQSRKMKKLYISAKDKSIYLSEDLSVPGGDWQLDRYFCPLM